jgi:8-amino-7-oxononanoate synthase
MQGLGYELGPDPGPVIAGIVDSPERALDLWRRLLDEGIYVNLILPPAAPDNKALVRVSVSAVHTQSDMDRICEAFTRLSQVP